MRGSIMWLGEELFASEMRPGGKGLGGDGSLASSSSSVGKRESGPLFSNGFPASKI